MNHGMIFNQTHHWFKLTRIQMKWWWISLANSSCRDIPSIGNVETTTGWKKSNFLFGRELVTQCSQASYQLGSVRIVVNFPTTMGSGCGCPLTATSGQEKGNGEWCKKQLQISKLVKYADEESFQIQERHWLLHSVIAYNVWNRRFGGSHGLQPRGLTASMRDSPSIKLFTDRPPCIHYLFQEQRMTSHAEVLWAYAKQGPTTLTYCDLMLVLNIEP